MALSRARLWQQMMQLSPVCSGSLHEQYLTCGKASCRCHNKEKPQRHGPYYLWVRRIDGKQVNRTLRAGPEVDRVREGIANYQRMQKLIGQLLEVEEGKVLELDRGALSASKKNFKWRSTRR